MRKVKVDIAFYEDYEKKLKGSLKHIITIGERCNCWEMYNDIRHSNGGNYHHRIWIYQIGKLPIYVRIDGNTREDFEGDTYTCAVLYVNDKPFTKIYIRDDETIKLLTKEQLKRLIEIYEQSEDYFIEYKD
jgi:hypothetical protein